MAARLPASVIFWPAPATNTTLAVAWSIPPVLPGNRSFIRSSAVCASMPGVDPVSSDSPDEVADVKPTAPSTAAHTSTTYQRRRNASRPSR
jgi:hypothetical protein